MMQTVTSRPQAPTARPAPASPTPGVANIVPLDPVKLLKQYYPYLALALVVGVGLGVGAHLLLLRVNPVYRASVTFETTPPLRNILGNDNVPIGQDDVERFMGTQVEIIKSDVVLREAVKKRELQQTEWAKAYSQGNTFAEDDAMLALSEDISARVLPQTDLIRLSMAGPDPEDVATICGVISNVYLADVKKRGRQDTAGRRQALNGNLNEVRRDKDRRLEEITRLLEDHNVDDLEVARGGAAIKVASLQRDLVETTQDLASLRSLLDRYEGELNNGQIGDDVRESVRQNPIIQSFESTIANLRAEVRAMTALGYQEQHPEVQALLERIDAAQSESDEVFEELIQKATNAQIESTRTAINSETAQETEMLTQLDEARREREDLLRVSEQVEQLKMEIVRLNEAEGAIEGALQNIEAIDELDTAYRVREIRGAQIPKEVAFPKLKVLVPLSAFACVGLVGGLIVLRELLDQRIKGPADVAMIPRMKVLGVIPDASEDPARPTTVETAFRDTPQGVTTESFRQIRTPLVKRMDQAGHKSLLVLSGMPGSGATTVLMNTALACAGGKERVLVIDANLRRPAVHKILGINDGPGLGDVLTDNATLDDAVQSTTTDGLFVLSAGTPENRMIPERLATGAMTKLLDEAKEQYDRVLIDAPPMIVSSDGVALANRCDATVMVVKAMSEKRGLVARLHNQITDTYSDFMGVVVNAVQSSAGGYFKRNIKATHEYGEAG